MMNNIEGPPFGHHDRAVFPCMVLTVHTPLSNATCYSGRTGIHREEKCTEKDINLFISYSILVDTVEHAVFNPLEFVLKDFKKNSNKFRLITI